MMSPKIDVVERGRTSNLNFLYYTPDVIRMHDDASLNLILNTIEQKKTNKPHNTYIQTQTIYLFILLASCLFTSFVMYSTPCENISIVRV